MEQETNAQQMSSSPISTPTQTPIQQATSPFYAQKGFLPLFFGMLMLLIAVAGGAYYLGTQKSNPMPTPITVEVQEPTNTQGTFRATNTSQVAVIGAPQRSGTADWKIYTNKALGFEIMYPPTMKVEKEMNDQYNRATIFKGGNLQIEVMLRKVGDIALDTYFYMDSPITRKATLAGLPANVYESPTGYCDGPGCSDPYISYVTKKEANLYHVSFIGDVQMLDIEKQILASFKFNN